MVSQEVSKIVGFSPASGDAAKSLLLVADDELEFEEVYEGSPSYSGLISYMPDGFRKNKVYLRSYQEVADATNQIIQYMDQGVLLVNYIGHSGLNRFAKEGLMLTSDVAALQNGDRLPLLTAFTCLVGRYEIPNYDSLGEELVLKKNGGAAAVWAPTGASLNPQAKLLAAELFKALFRGQDRVVGNAVVKALQRYAVTVGSKPFMLDIYNLLGDPALEIK